jgi:CubicO group peptidase (beta-lactamase class C family)
MTARSTAMVLAILGTVAISAAAQPRTRAATASKAIDALMQREMQTRSIPGAVVAVVEDGTIVFQQAYGFANLESDTPMTTRSIFEIASLTKQFTAAAILLLVDEGKLRLDDLLSVYIDNTPAAWQRITIRHLLTHTSGLDISAMPRMDGSAPLAISRKQALDFILQQPMFTATGRTGWYSDAGYVLLGMVIEKVSGQSYREFIIQRVFTPLAMQDSSLRDKVRVLKGRVATYSLRDGQLVNWRRESDYEVPAAFGIHSTVGDLALWDASLRRATLLKPASLEQMWTPAKLDDGEDAQVFMQRYGFGWELAQLRGRPTVGHGGASGTYVLRLVEEPLTVSVLTNLESQDRHPRTLARAIAGAVRPEYQPPEMLTTHPDPGVSLTKDVQAFLDDIGQRRASSLMSEKYAAWYRGAIGARAVMAKQLAGASRLQYLVHDDLAGRSLWGGEPQSRLVHYSADVNGRPYYLSVGLTADGKVASFEFQAGR